MRDEALATLDVLRSRTESQESRDSDLARWAALARDVGDHPTAASLLGAARALRVRALETRRQLAAFRSDCLLAYPGIRVPGDA